MADVQPNPHALQQQFGHEYQVWRCMRNRCANPRNGSWKYYGAKGIRVCRRWEESFAAFLEDMGQAPSVKHQIDRLSSEGHYEPGNCRWATAAEQQANTSKVRWIEYQGHRLPLSQWAKMVGIPQATLSSRLDSAGWSVERALGTPVAKKFRQKRRAFNNP